MLLILPIKRVWFDMIACGEKPEEYRDLKNYYKSRFQKYAAKPEFQIGFRAGYRKDSPFMRCRVSLTLGGGREEWGAPKGWFGFVLKIILVEEINYGNSSM